MTPREHCPDGGWLVSLDWWLPRDPRHAAWPSALKIGCNQLRCGRCGAEVRSGPPQPPTEAGPVQEVAREPRPAEPQPSSTARLYECMCHAEQVFAARPCDPSSAPPPYADAPPLPWACQGHAPVDLPTRLDGISLPAEPDALAAEVRACLGGGPPLAAGLPPGLAANQSGLWVAQLLRRLAEGSARGTVMTAVQDAVADPTLREAALNALRWAPSGDAGAELARSLRAAPDDARERRLGQAVEQLLLQVAAGKLHAPALVEAAFDALARGVAVPELVFMLAAIDPPRVATAGRALIGRSPKAIEYLASALEDHPGLLGPLFRHVVADGALPPDQLVGPSAGRLLSEAAIEIARAALA